jgi:hypothetical protein
MTLHKQRTTGAPMSQARRRIDAATATNGDRMAGRSGDAWSERAP